MHEAVSSMVDALERPIKQMPYVVLGETKPRVCAFWGERRWPVRGVLFPRARREQRR